MSDFKNTLYYGDNIEILKQLSKDNPKGFIDLVYIDPPFNSKRNYNMPFTSIILSEEDNKKNTAQKEAFKDTWSNIDLASELEEMKGYTDKPLVYQFLSRNKDVFDDSQMSYLTMMAHRIYYIHKVLKDSGSFYLHCDPTMSHYLKILLDIIFDKKNFRNEIVWCYKENDTATRYFPKKHDVIFFYTKNENYTFNIQRGDFTEAQLKRYNHIIDGERFANMKGKMRRLEGGAKFRDWWDMPITQKNERLGYPTQKPEALLDRIIKASSNEGDIVADFFCGCGTTITVAEKLKRKWLGVDINHLSISLVEEKRLKPLEAKYKVIGFPSDLASAEKLALDNKFSFEEWIVEYIFKGHKTKKTGDGGIDGHVAYNINHGKKLLAIMEVKGGNVNITQIRAFKDSITKFEADFGIFVAFGKYITDGMRKEANDLGQIQADLFPIKKMIIVTIEDIFSDNIAYELKSLTKNITY